MEITSKVKQKIEMQNKAEKNLKSKGKKKESNINSSSQIRNKSAKCKKTNVKSIFYFILNRLKGLKERMDFKFIIYKIHDLNY